VPSDHNKTELKNIPRRTFLISIGAGASGLAVSGLFAAMLRSVLPNVLYEPSARFRIGKPEDYVPDSITYLPEKKVFIFYEQDGFYVISSICTHLGCTIRLDAEQSGFTCPCHGSKFKQDGDVLKGPAKKPLVRFALYLSKRGEIIVDQNAIVDQNFRLTI
jgi:menaquinol-cytochrome c reductase iron-sulfur subunit